MHSDLFWIFISFYFLCPHCNYRSFKICLISYNTRSLLLLFLKFFLATLTSFFSYKFYNQSLMLQKKMVFWEWKVSLNLKLTWRIKHFTTLNFSTQEHGVYTSLLSHTYLHFRNFLFFFYRFYTFLVKLCLNIFLSFGIINVVCSAVMLTYYLCL